MEFLKFSLLPNSIKRYLLSKQVIMHLTVNLRSFKKLVRHNKKKMKHFLTMLQKNTPRGLDQMVVQADRLSWVQTDCLHCANCCKTMSPTYTRSDVQRISKFLGMSQNAFRKKWLFKDKSGDWLNVSQPCQFLDLDTNMCKIYDVRPRDCAGFPHHNKKRMVDYMHVYKQNLEFCPATHRMVKNLMDRLSKK
jgi:uncharacterized protein